MATWSNHGGSDRLLFRPKHEVHAEAASSLFLTREAGEGTAEGGGGGEPRHGPQCVAPPPCFAWSPSPVASNGGGTPAARHLLKARRTRSARRARPSGRPGLAGGLTVGAPPHSGKDEEVVRNVREQHCHAVGVRRISRKEQHRADEGREIHDRPDNEHVEAERPGERKLAEPEAPKIAEWSAEGRETEGRVPALGGLTRRDPSGVALGGAGARLHRLDFAVLRIGIRLKRIDQPARREEHLVDRAIERGLIGLRRPRKP